MGIGTPRGHRATRHLLAIVATCGAVLVVPLGAQAATRYASPTGTGPEPCVVASPCALTTATAGGLANGDTVILLGRTTGATSSLYDLSALPGRLGIAITRSNVTLAALEEGVTIRSNATTAAVRLVGGGTAIRRLTIQNVCGGSSDPDPAGCTRGAFAYALDVSGTAVDRVFAYSSERYACGLSGTVAVTNTVCLALNGGRAINIAQPGTIDLTNVTARSRYYPAINIAHQGAPCAPATVTIANTIVSSRATLAPPLWANRDGTPDACPLTLAMRTSSVPTRDVGMTVTLTETDMVAEAPTYSDATAIRPKATSPTVNRGSTGADDLARAGLFDLDGKDRVQGGRVDLGAYEYVEGFVAPPDPVIPGDLVGTGGQGDPGATGAAGGTEAAPALTVARTRAVVRPRRITVRGSVTAARAGVITRTVARVQGSRRIPICRIRRAVAVGTTDLPCAVRPSVRALLRRSALRLVVTTRFTPAGEAAIVDRQTLRLRRR